MPIPRVRDLFQSRGILTNKRKMSSCLGQLLWVLKEIRLTNLMNKRRILLKMKTLFRRNKQILKFSQLNKRLGTVTLFNKRSMKVRIPQIIKSLLLFFSPGNRSTLLSNCLFLLKSSLLRASNSSQNYKITLAKHNQCQSLSQAIMEGVASPPS